MKIFILEEVNKTVDFSHELNYLLAIIAKEISGQVAMFLPEQKLIGKISKKDILKKLGFSEIEIIQNLDVKKQK